MKIAWIFSGQGAQFVGMGKDLYETSAAARAVYEEADRTLGWSVSQVCFEGPAEKLTSSEYCQPSIYTTSMACLAAYQERFPRIPGPVAAAGLSLGEYAALASAGVFSFAEGLKLVAKRGALMDAACRAADGSMASIIAGDPETIEQVCRDCDIDVANYNCPGQIVISGPRDRVEKAAAAIKAAGAKRALVLNVAGAFHSRMMASAGIALKDVLDGVNAVSPAFHVVQNFPGAFVSDPALIKENLVRQVAGSVRWETCVRQMIAGGADAFIEFGPGSVLTGLVRRTDGTKTLFNVSAAADLDKIVLD